jgi:hypothetical protein
MKEFPMQEVINKYFNNHKKCEEVIRKLIPLKYPDFKNDIKYITTTFWVTEIDRIEKINFNIVSTDSEKNLFCGSLKVYELVFIDYPDLNTDDVLNIIHGFINFLKKHNFDNDTIKEKADWFCSLLEMNPNLPEDLKLWIKLR